MEVVEEVKVDLFSGQADEPEVKVEPYEDSKDLGDLAKKMVKSDDDEEETMATMWSYLVQRSRYLYQTSGNGPGKMECAKLTRTLLQEVEQLLEEVSGFVRNCCSLHTVDEAAGHSLEVCVAVNERVAGGLLLSEKSASLHVNELSSLPENFQTELFAPFHSKELHSDHLGNLDLIQLPSFSTLPSMNSFNESDDDDMDASFDTNSNSGDSSSTKFSQYPRPKIVPVDYNKKKQVCVCEQCGGSWSRKEYYYHHKTVGKCTPKWIRYSAKNKNRIRCVHPDCETKKEVNFTYAGIMKHIIDLHTSQESATLQCPDCPLKFPMKAVLKFHQDSVHQAHAMICTICGKIVRDMRKHKLVHSGEKPFQCDRCSYRCSRSGTLKRHMATHLNSNEPPRLDQLPQHDSQQHQIQQHQMQEQIQLEQQTIPIHIQHHDANSIEEPKYLDLNAQTLAQHMPPHSAYSPSPPPNNMPYRDFKFQ